MQNLKFNLVAINTNNFLNKQKNSKQFFKLYYNKFFGDLFFTIPKLDINFQHYDNRSLFFEGYFFGSTFFFSKLLDLPKFKRLHFKLIRGCLNVFVVFRDLLLEPFFKLNLYNYFFFLEYFRVKRLLVFRKKHLKLKKVNLMSLRHYKNLLLAKKKHQFGFSNHLAFLLYYSSSQFLYTYLRHFNFFKFWVKFYNLKLFLFLNGSFFNYFFHTPCRIFSLYLLGPFFWSKGYAHKITSWKKISLKKNLNKVSGLAFKGCNIGGLRENQTKLFLSSF